MKKRHECVKKNLNLENFWILSWLCNFNIWIWVNFQVALFSLVAFEMDGVMGWLEGVVVLTYTMEYRCTGSTLYSEVRQVRSVPAIVIAVWIHWEPIEFKVRWRLSRYFSGHKLQILYKTDITPSNIHSSATLRKASCSISDNIVYHTVRVKPIASSHSVCIFYLIRVFS